MPREIIKKSVRKTLDKPWVSSSEELKHVISFIPLGTSPLKVALYYAKMRRDKGFNPVSLIGINPIMFSSETICRTTVSSLRNNRCVAQGDNGLYFLTTRGSLAISLIAMREPTNEQVTSSAGGL